jgi:hypothetical protein
MSSTSNLTLSRRLVEKERSRQADVRAQASGQKTAEQIKRESEAFAFPKGRARINLLSAASLF